MEARIDWDEAAFAGLLDSPEGPVGQYIAELSQFGAQVARAAVPILSRPAGPRSTAAAPGETYASIHPVLGYGARGLWGGVNAIFSPSVFLETPAKQMHRTYPFLTTALWAIIAIAEADEDSWVWPEEPR